jgi:uncharacterized protein (DUF4415 family)
MDSKDTGFVIYRPDSHHPSILTEEEWLAWEELQEKSDKDIDVSDIPPQPGVGWQRVLELVPAQNKQQITLRLDADVIEFFRATGRRYQSRINAALREYVTAQQKAG